MEEFIFPKNIKIANAIKDAKLCSSTSDALRMIKAGAVKIDGTTISDKDIILPAEAVYQVGKRKFARIKIKG